MAAVSFAESASELEQAEARSSHKEAYFGWEAPVLAGEALAAEADDPELLDCAGELEELLPELLDPDELECDEPELADPEDVDPEGLELECEAVPPECDDPE